MDYMPKLSAGILLYRKAATGYEVLLVHPGGPFWAKKDKGAWSVPKGEFNENEMPIDAAKREFKEETGSPAPDGDYTPLVPVKQPSGKVVHTFTCQADFAVKNFKSDNVEIEWPPKSGKKQLFPENDKAAWVSLPVARQKVVKGQVPIIEQLASLLGATVADVIIDPSEGDQIALL